MTTPKKRARCSPLIAVPLRQAVQRIPLEQAIEIINDAQGFLGDAQGFLGPAQGVIEQLLPGGLGGLGLP